MQLLSGYLKRVLECFVNKDLPGNLFFSTGADGAQHKLVYSSPGASASVAAPAPSGKRRPSAAASTPRATVQFDYETAVALTDICADMIKPYDMEAVRVTRELPGERDFGGGWGDAGLHSPGAPFRLQGPLRVSRFHGEEGSDEEEDPAARAHERRGTALDASMEYARETLLKATSAGIVAALRDHPGSPTTMLRLQQRVNEALNASLRGGGGGAGAPPGAGPPAPSAGRASALSGRPLVPSLKDIIRGDWGNVGKVWDLWDGTLPGYPALKYFRGGPDGLLWQWDPSHPTEHTQCQGAFARLQAVVTECLCYVQDYDKPQPPASDPTAAASGVPEAYMPVTQEDWDKREISLPAARQWALAQFAHRWRAFKSVERVYNYISTKNAKSVDGLSEWEQARDAQRRQFKDFNRKISKAKPTPAAGCKRKADPAAKKEAAKKVRIMPTAEDIKAGLKLHASAAPGGGAPGGGEVAEEDSVEDSEDEGAEELEVEDDGDQEAEAEATGSRGKAVFVRVGTHGKQKAAHLPKADKSRSAGTRPKSRKQRTGGTKRSRGLDPEIRANSGWTGTASAPLPKGMFEDAEDDGGAANPKRRRH
jgi:hypothetical protein